VEIRKVESTKRNDFEEEMKKKMQHMKKELQLEKDLEVARKQLEEENSIQKRANLGND